MKRALIMIMILLSFAISGYTQQDPNDPGLPDSVIIGQSVVDSGSTFAFVDLEVVTDEPVTFYHIPIDWSAPYGGTRLDHGTVHLPPLTAWQFTGDSIFTGYARLVGWNSSQPDTTHTPLNTHGSRLWVMMLRFLINPNTPSQLVLIDTVGYSQGRGFYFGIDGREVLFHPAFVPGYLAIGNVGTNDDPNVPQTINLAQNYPNPFNSSTEIEFSLPQSGSVSLVIYDIQGREIRKLLDCDIGSGSQKIIWNGTDNNNVDAASGIYFYRLTYDNIDISRRMTLLR